MEKEIVEELYKEYLTGKSVCALEREHKIDHSTIYGAFKKYGFKTRSNKINSRKYHLDENAFSVINTPEKAYWIGFLSSDGYVSLNNGQKIVGFAIHKKDRKQVEKFRKFLNADYPIHDYTQKTTYGVTEFSRIAVTSDKLYNDVVANGVVEHKTNILEPPKLVPYGLIKYYILGYFDGDGSIYKNEKTKDWSWAISIVSTDSVLEFIENYLFENGVVDKIPKLEKRKKEQIVSSIRYSGTRRTCAIMDFLYEGIDENIPLKRKRDRYLECKSILNSPANQ